MIKYMGADDYADDVVIPEIYYSVGVGEWPTPITYITDTLMGSYRKTAGTVVLAGRVRGLG